MGHEIAIAKGNPSRTLFIHSDLVAKTASRPRNRFPTCTTMNLD